LQSVVEVHPNCKGDDYLMIQSLTVENFRCFEHVELSDLKRINVVVGQNASGKTALLESIFFAGGGHSQLALRMRAWRLLPDVQITTANPETFEEVWRDLFFNFDQSRTIAISLRGTPQNTRTFRIFYDAKTEHVVPVGQKLEEVATLTPLSFEYSDSEGHRSLTKAEINERGLVLPGPTPFFMNVSMYVAGIKANPKEAAERFSALSKKNQERHLVETLTRIFPFIDDLSVQTSAGESMVFASVSTLPEKVPVSLISEGVYRLLSVLVGIASTKNGAVMIDELENGFYHEKLPEIWKLLLEFAEEYKTQLFVSTHSLEALKHAGPTIKGNESKFALLRTERTNGNSSVRYFSGHQFLKAIEQKVDVR